MGSVYKALRIRDNRTAAVKLMALKRARDKKFVARFVADIRTAYPDPVAQRDAVYRAYAHVAGDARGYLEGYFSDPANDPRQQGRGYRRAVEVTNVLPVPGAAEGGPATSRVLWNEREESPREGVRERAWEGYLSVTVAPPTTTEAVERNPLGVFVTDLSWSPLAPTAGDAAPSDSDTEVEEVLAVALWESFSDGERIMAEGEVDKLFSI